MKERFGGMFFRAIRGHIVKTFHCLFVWVFENIYGNNWYCYHWTSSVNPISSIVKTLCEAFFACIKHIRSLLQCKETYSKCDKINYLFYFLIKKSIVIPKVRPDMGCYLLCWERVSSTSYFPRWQSMYCHPPWSLFVQCVEHLLTCQGESQMNKKAVYVFHEWPHFIFATADLKLLRQISTVRLLSEKRHT
jgi:hypothetical protein